MSKRRRGKEGWRRRGKWRTATKIDRLLEYLNDYPLFSFDVKMINIGTGITITTIRALLSVLLKSGEIQRVVPGIYASLEYRIAVSFQCQKQRPY